MSRYSYERSLRIYEIIAYLKFFWLGSFISILFLGHIGLTDVDIGIFHFIFGALVFLFEIPTGGFADRYGYRMSIIFSFLFLSLTFLSFLSAIFLGKAAIFVFSALFLSLHGSFASGADKSYVFTIFRHEERLEKYIDFQSRISRNGRIIGGAAIIL